jgi:hypothetical protein
MVVIGLAAIVGIAYGSHEWYQQMLLDRSVDEAWPKVCQAIEEQRDTLVKAIEEYHSALGIYPPDHVESRNPLIINSETNQLMYELLGTVFDPTNKAYVSGVTDVVPLDELPRVFGVTEFKNAPVAPNPPRRFLNRLKFSIPKISSIPESGGLGFGGFPREVVNETCWEFVISPWNYNTTKPTHNPGKFDVWIDVAAGSHHRVIGNWTDPTTR